MCEKIGKLLKECYRMKKKYMGVFYIVIAAFSLHSCHYSLNYQEIFLYSKKVSFETWWPFSLR